jgi:ATP-dependent DNA ligase
MARRDPVGVRLLTRKGNDRSTRFPLIVGAVELLRVRSCLINGEVICCNDVLPRCRKHVAGNA